MAKKIETKNNAQGRFVQLHILTSYPPANLNRDDLGRPKTALMGGANRLRISSQSLKRAWRTSDVFEKSIGKPVMESKERGFVGIRTKEMGKQIYAQLIQGGVKEKDALAWAVQIAGVFGKSKKSSKDEPLQELEIEQMAHFSPEEIYAIETLVSKVSKEKKAPDENDLKLLKKENSAADIAMFGRMLADSPAFNIEAAVQVAHAITVHKAAVEDDFFTAVDDLNRGEEDMGAGHLGEAEFGAGLFYIYVCINTELLLENLNGDTELTQKSLRALTEAALTVAPTGKQNSYASRARASYCMVERGDQQPRSLHVAFLAPVSGLDPLGTAIKNLKAIRSSMDNVYGRCWESAAEFDCSTPKPVGSVNEVLDFVSAL